MHAPLSSARPGLKPAPQAHSHSTRSTLPPYPEILEMSRLQEAAAHIVVATVLVTSLKSMASPNSASRTVSAPPPGQLMPAWSARCKNRPDRQTDRQTDGQTDGRTDRQRLEVPPHTLLGLGCFLTGNHAPCQYCQCRSQPLAGVQPFCGTNDMSLSEESCADAECTGSEHISTPLLATYPLEVTVTHNTSRAYAHRGRCDNETYPGAAKDVHQLSAAACEEGWLHAGPLQRERYAPLQAARRLAGTVGHHPVAEEGKDSLVI